MNLKKRIESLLRLPEDVADAGARISKRELKVSANLTHYGLNRNLGISKRELKAIKIRLCQDASNYLNLKKRIEEGLSNLSNL